MPPSAADPKPETEKDDVRTAKVVYATGSSRTASNAAVSLPAEPWSLGNSTEVDE